MKVLKRTNGSIKMTAENGLDSEKLYMLFSAGMHSPKWFNDKVGKHISRRGDLILVVDLDHADVLFNSQEQGIRYKEVEAE